MANEDHLAILRKGVKAWNAWRTAHRDVRPDLSGANLSAANLRGANLAAANLEGANLGDANLVGAHLAYADLERANLTAANLEGAHLTGANLAGADLAGANLEGAYLADANLKGANLKGANLADANLADANLARANLEGANLYGANVEGATQTGTSDGGLALLTIPLHLWVPAGDLGLILNGLADLYALALEEGGEPRSDTLIAHRISVGTPNEVELIGMLPQITAIAAALLAVLKVPKALGEGAEKLAAARKTWIEGTLLKQKIDQKAEPQKRVPEASVARIEVAFNALAQGKEIVSGEPKLRIVGTRGDFESEDAQEEEMPKRA